MLDIIVSRRSVRSWKTDAVGSETLDRLVKAGLHAPSGMNQRPLHFIVLSGAKLEEVLAGSPNTPKGAPAAIVVCVDADLEKIPGLGSADAAAATENILLAAESLGLGAVWSAVLPTAADHYRKALALPDSVRPYSIVPVGKAASRPDPVDRWDPERVHRNGW